MNDNQENKRTMFLAVRAVLLVFEPVWTASLVFTNNFNIFDAFLNTIDTLRNQQEQQTTGVAKDKKAQRLLLIPELLKFIAAIKSLASDTNDNTLFDEANYPKSSLDRVRDSIFIDICHVIHDLADANAVALVDYGITAGMITQLATDTDDFVTLNPKPRASKAVTADATAQIETVIANTMKHLTKKMDNLVSTYAGTNDDFVAQYKTARIIIDLGGSTGIKGTVTDAATERKLKGALVEIKEVEVQQVTNSRGNYHFKKVPPGKYTVVVTLKNYVKGEFVNVLIEQGKTLDFDVELGHV